MIAVELAWKPKAKDRPRATKSGVIYTPKATKDAEKALRDQWPAVIEPFDEPIAVTLVVADDRVIVYIEPIKKPLSKMRGDIDNLAKTVLDALNKVAYTDDRHIKRLTVEIL